MDYKIMTTFPDQLLFKALEPCISIYMPTHRLIFQKKQDVLVFKNLVKEVKLSLEKRYSSRDTKELILRLKKIEKDFDLWNYSLDGLVLFATLEEMIIYRVEMDLKPLAIVANSFHIKPLIQYYEAIETFTLLALEATSFALYEGNYLDIQSMVLPQGTETTLAGLLGTQRSEDHLTRGGAIGSTTFHGQGGKSDEIDIDRIKFFRYVDRFVLEQVSNKTKYPLLLVAHKEHHFDFKKISINPFIIEEAIEGSYANFKANDLKQIIQKINDQRFSQLIQQAVEQYHNLHNKALSSDQLVIVLKALLNGRVETLFIEEDKIIPGRIDHEQQQIIRSSLDDPQTDDLLDDMVQVALSTKTRVYVLDKSKMPTTTGVAAIFRY